MFAYYLLIFKQVHAVSRYILLFHTGPVLLICVVVLAATAD